MMNIALATTDEEIELCFPVMQQLRPMLVAGQFVETVRRLQRQGYQLAYLEQDGKVIAVAGFRVGESLAWGRFMYVDDLVSLDSARSRGYGQRMFDWLVGQASDQNCDQLHLDSGVQRFGAHRFYLRNRMDITSHHFSMELGARP
jgi:GNAT superfamily N-acetyltransferase